MRFKLSVCSMLFMIPLSYTGYVLAEINPPLDLIELLGEMGDDENMLEIALSELRKSTSESQKNHDNKQNSDVATPVGGSKK